MLSLSRSYPKSYGGSYFTAGTMFDHPKSQPRDLFKGLFSVTRQAIRGAYQRLRRFGPRRGIHPRDQQLFESEDVSSEQT